MKICFFGSSLVSSYWNGAATYYRGLLKEIAAFGHEIIFFEPNAFDRQAHRDRSGLEPQVAGAADPFDEVDRLDLVRLGQEEAEAHAVEPRDGVG